MPRKALLFGIVVVLVAFSASPAFAVVQTPKKGVGGQIGGGMPAVEDNPPVLRQLGVSWFYNWALTAIGFMIAPPACVEYVPMVRYKDSTDFRKSEIEGAIITRGYKGYYWLIGNEPDDAGASDSDAKLTSQENLMNSYVQYAKIIKAADPTAKLIVWGFISIRDFTKVPPKEPVGLNFARLLRDALAANGITPAGWHIHLYPYQNGCCDFNAFKTMLSGWLNWQNTVLGGGETWVTEFGPFQATYSANDIQNYMKLTTNFLQNSNDVDRYAWFSLSNGGGGQLYIEWAGGLTSYGTLYASLPDQGTWPSPAACEITPTSTVEPCPDGVSGNLNCDAGGLINEADLSILLNSWATAPNSAPDPPAGQYRADLNGDTKVDESDLSILLGNWKTS